MKMKQESSGYPTYVKTEKDRQKYIIDYYEQDGILLDRSKIEKNPSFCTISKLYCNTLWGNFAERDNQSM